MSSRCSAARPRGRWRRRRSRANQCGESRCSSLDAATMRNRSPASVLLGDASKSWAGRKAATFKSGDRSADGDPELLRVHAVALARSAPEVILTDSTPATAALQQATRSIPIVFVNAQNPVGSGFVASIARPGSNITGFVAFEPTMGGKWLEIIKEVAPDMARVALLHNPQTHTGQYWRSIEAAAPVLAVQIIPAPFREATDIEQTIAAFARGPKGGLVVLPDTSTTLHRELIVRLAARHRLPAIYPFRFFVADGGLISYGVDEIDQYRRAAGYVDRILKGEKPGDLPVQAPTKFELVINLKTAKALSLEVPPMLLARADEVIE